MGLNSSRSSHPLSNGVAVIWFGPQRCLVLVGTPAHGSINFFARRFGRVRNSYHALPEVPGTLVFSCLAVAS